MSQRVPLNVRRRYGAIDIPHNGSVLNFRAERLEPSSMGELAKESTRMGLRIPYLGCIVSLVHSAALDSTSNYALKIMGTAAEFGLASATAMMKVGRDSYVLVDGPEFREDGGVVLDRDSLARLLDGGDPKVRSIAGETDVQQQFETIDTKPWARTLFTEDELRKLKHLRPSGYLHLGLPRTEGEFGFLALSIGQGNISISTQGMTRQNLTTYGLELK